ncbi:MAG: flagellar biosynthetic protein FliO [Ignavibacteriales bacterium]|nr:flagellar biosynthetic protein FliO [Ignavibacteriales bacterium]
MGFVDIFKVILILTLLVGVMYLVLYLTKKFLYQGNSRVGAAHAIKVLATQMIMPKKYVSIIQIEQVEYIVGIADNSFTLLDKRPASNPPETESHEDTLMKRLKGSIRLS